MAGKKPLRVYFGPDDLRGALSHSVDDAAPGVEITLSQLLATWNDASRHDRAWIRDFQDEKVTVSADLYQVILAYQRYRRKTA